MFHLDLIKFNETGFHGMWLSGASPGVSETLGRECPTKIWVICGVNPRVNLTFGIVYRFWKIDGCVIF